MGSPKASQDTLYNVMQLAVDKFGQAMSASRDFQLAVVDLLRKAASTRGADGAFVQSSLDLMTTAIESQHAMREGLTDKLRQAVAIVGGNPPRPVSQKPTPGSWRPALPYGAAVCVAVRQDEARTVVPITLYNHLNTQEIVTLHATPFREVGGASQEKTCLRLYPERVELPPQDSAVVHAILEPGPEFQPGKDYMAEIRIDGADPRCLPLRLTILPPMAIEQKPSLSIKPSEETEGSENADRDLPL